MSADLYCDTNGRVVCAEHGGQYLRSALARDPRATHITTPATLWFRLTAPERATLAEADLDRCEECSAPGRR
jgi:hypothetical protein